MIGTIVAVIIPLVYLFMGSLSARYIYRRNMLKLSKGYNPGFDSADATVTAVLAGILWPVVIPFYVAMTFPSHDERRQQRIKDRREAIERSEQDLRVATQALQQLKREPRSIRDTREYWENLRRQP